MLAADRRVVSGGFHQIIDLTRGDREEPDSRERAAKCGGERQHEVVPLGQVGSFVSVPVRYQTGRRGWGEDSIYFDHSGECRDPETHRHCPGRWRGVVSLKPAPTASAGARKSPAGPLTTGR